MLTDKPQIFTLAFQGFFMNCKKIFKSLQKYINDNHDNISLIRNRCPDEKRGFLRYKDRTFTYDENSQKQVSKKIIFILESPHKNEFCKNGTSLGPAKGKTGDNFKNCLIDFCILAQYYYSAFEEGFYEIWIANAIQYQVSLGMKTKEYRSLLFQVAWHTYGKENFKLRLTNLLNCQKTIIVNACTKGTELKKRQAEKLLQMIPIEEKIKNKIKLNESQVNLKGLVQDAIDELNSCNLIVNANHPSNWGSIVQQQS